MDPVYLQDNFHLDTTGATSETTSDSANGGGVNASLTDPSLPLLFAHKIVDQIVCAIAHVATHLNGNNKVLVLHPELYPMNSIRKQSFVVIGKLQIICIRELQGDYNEMLFYNSN